MTQCLLLLIIKISIYHLKSIIKYFKNIFSHGTKCAGVAVANGNNSICGVGVAYKAEIGAIRVLDGTITDLIEARALAYMSKNVDIKSASCINIKK